MGALAGYIGFKETSQAIGSHFVGFAAFLASMWGLWKVPIVNVPARWLWRHLVDIPREERAAEHALAIRAPILEQMRQLREENASQHGEVRAELRGFNERLVAVEEAMTAPRKERL